MPLRIEAKLISAFGTEQTGGLLTNSVIPSDLVSAKRSHVVVPQGAVEQAQLGLDMLKGALNKLIDANVEGITNSEAASLLGLRSDYNGRQKDYLSYSVLGLLLREGRVIRREGRPPEARFRSPLSRLSLHRSAIWQPVSRRRQAAGSLCAPTSPHPHGRAAVPRSRPSRRRPYSELSSAPRISIRLLT